MKLRWLVILCVALSQHACNGSEAARGITVAVAANFYETASDLTEAFTQRYGVDVTLVSGSSGKLFAQITNGAPFDVFLSADEMRANKLEASGHALQGSGFVYALGRLTLWSSDPQLIENNGKAVLRSAKFKHIALANPALAPYGHAAREVLQSLGLLQTLEKHIVTAENVAQVFAMVATGNAELGFLSRAAIVSSTGRASGSRWDVPASLHGPIRQRAVLLLHGEANDGAREFCEFLQSPVALNIIRQAGYDTE